MLLNEVVETSAAVAATRSRTAKTAAIAELLRGAGPGDARLAVAYLSGVVPQGRLGVGWRSLGDPPAAAAEPGLALGDVDAAFAVLAGTRGAGSRGRRADALAALLGAATADEQDFLRRLMIGELRQGALDAVVTKALADAADVPEAVVRRVAMLAGGVVGVVDAALTGGVAALEAVSLTPGVAVSPMLAASAPDIAAALEGAGPLLVERKIDGIRLQAHRVGGRVRLFTRSLEEVTERLPEVVEVVAALPGGDLVLDGEAIALRPDGRPHPFQVTGSRTSSRRSTEAMRDEVPLSAYFFDVLHADGRDLIDEPLRTRRGVLEALLGEESRVPSLETDDVDAAQAFFAAQVADGHEGVVVKALDATWAAGRRGAGWVKVKPRHTLDLVVLAVERGSGRRTGTLSNIHLGARDPETGGFVMLGKTFKGMTDAMLAWQTERFTELATGEDGPDGDGGDGVVRVRPEQVVEIAFDGVQRSTRYPGGVALRFARVLRYRDDKGPGEADTIETVRSLLA
ncbi:ATP-dependent DNA ligase [Mariniluteicoccus flavus]